MLIHSIGFAPDPTGTPGRIAELAAAGPFKAEVSWFGRRILRAG